MGRISEQTKLLILGLARNGWTDGEVAALTGVNKHSVKAIRTQAGLMRWEQKPKQRYGYGIGDDCGGVPAEATDTRPGSAAHMAVLRQRAQAGVDLWHPNDATME